MASPSIPLSPPSPLSSRSTSHPVSPEKRTGLPGTPTEYSTTSTTLRLGTNLSNKAGSGNPVGGKGFQQQSRALPKYLEIT